ncbi:hypothetical protein [Marinobacter caseinilyticus]|uniref:hypothetical protein n=1 Tax=Marinobacter caseinilyticus TaxID=2692195 RepID=UPI00140AF4FE|nr:hypothetical protein [Marinobacter caseinilyticus]
MMRLLLKQLLSYLGYLMTSVSLAVWAGASLLVVSLFSQDATIIVLDMLVSWGGDIFAPMETGGLLVFSSDQSQVGPNDVDGVEAVMHLAGGVSLVLYVLGTLFTTISGKTMSLTRAAKLTFVRRFALAAFVGILLSSVLRFESGAAPESVFTAGFLAIFVAPALLLSGYGSVFCNGFVNKAMEHVDSAG